MRGFGYASKKLDKSLSINPDYKDFEGRLEKWQKYSPLTTRDGQRGVQPGIPPLEIFFKIPPRILRKSVLNHTKIDIFEPPLKIAGF